MKPLGTISLVMLGALIGLFALSGHATAKKIKRPVLTSVRTSAGIVLDAKAECAWSKAKALEVTWINCPTNRATATRACRKPRSS